MLRSRLLWVAILGFAVIVHLDWHLGRPGQGPLDGNVPYHWVLGLLTGALLVWFGTRYWPTRSRRAAAAVVTLGAALGQGAEPLAEVLLSGGWEPLTYPVRWRVFIEFLSATGVGFLVLLGLRARRAPPLAR